MDYIRYKSSSPCGDLVSFLSGIKQVWKDSGKKGIIYQRLNMQGVGTATSIHPYKNELGQEICFNSYAFEMMRPLLLAQECIEDYIVYEGQEFDVDFDLIRMERFTNQPLGSLNRFFNYVFPDMASDLSKSWIDVSPHKYKADFQELVAVNFTLRYRNPIVDYSFLKKFEERLFFLGLPEEKKAFCSEWNLDVPSVNVASFYELAQVLNSCKFFLGNQSFCFQLCESMKKPRILEIFPMMPNVIPVGNQAFDFYHTEALHYYFNKLINE